LTQPLDRYRQIDLSTASPLTLVVKLYEGAMRNAMQARVHLEEGQISDRAKALSKALAIVGELQATIDLEQGSEIGANLDALYTYVSERLVDANLSGRVESIDEALDVLTTLHEAWLAISRGGGDAPGSAAP